MADSLFEPNPQAAAQLRSLLSRTGEQVVTRCLGVLRRGAQEWRRQVQRVVPVEFGTLRQSWQVVVERNGNDIKAVLGTSLKSPDGKPYPLYLELGTKYIAGGAVLAWTEGQPPVMDWPAKHADLPNFRLTADRRSRAYTMPMIGGAVQGRRRVYTMTKAGGYAMKTRERSAGRGGTARFERSVHVASKAFTAGQGEQMPFLRPTGYGLRPQILKQLAEAVKGAAGA